MSSVARRRSRGDAIEEAKRFRALLEVHRTCQRFEFAGSLRRQKPDVGDVDIVAIPRFDELPGDDMFATPGNVNLLWLRLDKLLEQGAIAKCIMDTKAGPRTKWGYSCRAIEWHGCRYEIQLADEDNFGPWLAIRTGPEELSHEFASRIGKYGYGFRDGFHVWDMKATPPRMIPAVTEEQLFKMVGLPFKPPEHR